MNILPTINSPQDLKRLNAGALLALAGEVREFLVQSLSDTGGHLASNLGVVELTLALHRVFDTPGDKIVWDVGHQSYVHKILTGRRDDFLALRKLDGLSGFPKMHESAHDAFGAGHSSTAISAALGLAKARDLRGCGKGRCKKASCKKACRQDRVIAVVGDGSMTGGLAFEGLNNAGRSNTDLLVVLNDNQMSICRNVGAISRHLNEIRTTGGYLGAKAGVHRLLEDLPLVGAPLTRGLESFKSLVKRAVLQGVLFEEMGFRYFGPVDGHDIKALTAVMEAVKKIRGPVLLHVLTKKGKGYNCAERSPTNFHGVGTFHIDTGEPTKVRTSLSYTDVFGQHLCKLAEKDKRIVAVSAAMSDGTGLEEFTKRFPRRFFDVGIAEGHAVTFAAGLAAGGLRPVVAIYSSFMQRAYDQILHDVAIQNLPVILCLDRAGIVGEDGETHQGLYDLAYLSHIPNLTILAPSTTQELTAMLDHALTINAPVAIRYPRPLAGGAPREAICEASISTSQPEADGMAHVESSTPASAQNPVGRKMRPTEMPPIIQGQAETIRRGKEIAIISVGAMRDTALAVVETLIASGNDPSLYNARFVKPIDANLLEKLREYKHIFTIEDGVAIGGFGSRVNGAHVFAFPDSFIEAGTREELFARYSLDAISIANKIQMLTSN
ncbi:MAG: 1-deoxy-D-xylulose-5-phosphate synthase [Defluviitaleaceae bacterium]|nr:1-deoxy-D-xylulose-5-phosphate synthase [Defluviitaleaceae bacterium]